MPKIDAGLRAAFKEHARRIIAQDRAARKYGRSQNTIGEIERALVQAFTLGRDGGTITANTSPTSDAGDVVDWAMIPPRARDSLLHLSIWLCRGRGTPEPQIVAERVIVDGRERWRDIEDRGQPNPHTSSASSVNAFVGMGLLEFQGEDHGLLAITDKGLATAQEYWRRSDARDPTLPLIGRHCVVRFEC